MQYMNNLEFTLLLQFALWGTLRLTKVASFLKEEEGSIELLREMPRQKFEMLFHSSRESLLKKGREVADPAQEIELAKKHSIQLIGFEDGMYPDSLKTISDPPLILYVQGEIQGPDELCLAMVGTRHPSIYGKETALRFGRDLASLGFIIVSGLARGIDTASHRGALEGGGKTMGVSGSGLLNPYPPENRPLMERIQNGRGALLSELPLCAKPLAHHFPLRNRILSGLARGTCVIEAAERSGSLITAHCALEQGREVYAVPGMISSLNAQGTLKLIQQGAKLVRKSQDIVEDYLPWLAEAVVL